MKAAQLEAITKHGENLLAIFAKCVERDPVKLCKKLRIYEREATSVGLRLCNGPEFETETACDELTESILRDVDAVLQFSKVGVPVFINLDPRGYALKIDDDTMRTKKLNLHSDWGSNGIIAPEITE